jgi:hypothetical protein
MTNATTMITPLLASNVLWCFTAAGREPDSFTWSLINTVHRRVHRRQQAAVYPAVAEAIELADRAKGGIDVLKTLAKGDRDE